MDTNKSIRGIVFFVIVFLLFTNVVSVAYITVYSNSQNKKSDLITELKTKLIDLENNQNSLFKKSVELDKTRDDLECAKKRLADLETINMDLQTRQKESEIKLESVNQPKDPLQNYYPAQGDRSHNLDYLKKVVDSWTPLATYELNVYDCSEMAAHLEWYLETNGIQAEIVEGNSPYGYSTGHAWLYAYTDTKQYAVDATSKEIIYYEGGFLSQLFVRVDPFYYNSKNVNKVYNTIFDVPKSRLAEFDWWNVKKGGA
jgi:hypothetical protein